MAKKKSTYRKAKRTGKSGRLFVIFVLLVSLLGFFYYSYKNDKKFAVKHELLSSIPQGFSSFGIDISHHQGEINWENLFYEHELDSVISFIYCKATEGVDHVDTQWEYNRNSLKELGKPHGAYHFFSVRSDPKQQALHFLRHWKDEQNDLPPVLDVETEAINDQVLIRDMKIWLATVEKETVHRPIIYTSLHFYETKFVNEFNDYFFWIAAYSRKPKCLSDPRIIHWQYSDTGILPEIKEKVDFNVSKITFD